MENVTYRTVKRPFLIKLFIFSKLSKKLFKELTNLYFKGEDDQTGSTEEISVSEAKIRFHEFSYCSGILRFKCPEKNIPSEVNNLTTEHNLLNVSFEEIQNCPALEDFLSIANYKNRIDNSFKDNWWESFEYNYNTYDHSPFGMLQNAQNIWFEWRRNGFINRMFDKRPDIFDVLLIIDRTHSVLNQNFKSYVLNYLNWALERMNQKIFVPILLLNNDWQGLYLLALDKEDICAATYAFIVFAEKNRTCIKIPTIEISISSKAKEYLSKKNWVNLKNKFEDANTEFIRQYVND